jgi:hypothetical protein
MTRNYQEQEANAAAQHALQMQQLAETHADNVWSLASARDALGLVKEDEHYSQQVAAANAAYKLQQQEAAQAYADQLAAAAQAFADQQAQQQQAYDNQVADANAQEQKQLAQLDAAHELEMAKLQQQEADKLKQLDDAYKKQTADLKKNFLDVIQQMEHDAGVWILNDKAAYEAGGEADLAAFKAWILANEVVPPSGTTASGGYRSFLGPGENGKPEYVLSNHTTRAMESMLGGSLSQAKLLSAVMAARGGSGGMGGGNMNITVQGGSLTMRQVRMEIENALDSKLSDLIPAWGG